MSLMYCNDCRVMYGPTLVVCPNCGSGNVSRAELTSDSGTTAVSDLVSYDSATNTSVTHPPNESLTDSTGGE